jgi:peroxiredoxin
MQLNQLAPDFELPDLQGNLHRLSRYRGRIVIVNFWSAECAYSVRTDELILNWLTAWGSKVILLSVAMNRNESVRSLEEAALERGLSIVLMDAGFIVTDLYGVQVTPHIFVIDGEGVLRYRGAVDDVSFRQREATRSYLKEAVEALLTNRLPDLPDTPAYGCALVREI